MTTIPINNNYYYYYYYYYFYYYYYYYYYYYFWGVRPGSRKARPDSESGYEGVAGAKEQPGSARDATREELAKVQFSTGCQPWLTRLTTLASNRLEGRLMHGSRSRSKRASAKATQVSQTAMCACA